MYLPASDRYTSVTATGGETEIPLSWPVFAAADVKVLLNRFGSDVELSLGTYYSIYGIGQTTGAKILLTYPASPGDVYTVYGDMAPERATSINANASIPSAALNNDIDRLVVMAQELRREIARLWAVAGGGSTGGGSTGGGELHDAELLALSSLPSAVDTLPYFTGPGAAALAPFTATARELIGLTTPEEIKQYINAASSNEIPPPGYLLAIIKDIKSSGISGGGFTAGSFIKRDLNTLLFNRDSIVTLSNNNFELSEGVYEITWSAPAFGVNNHISALYNETMSQFVEYGKTSYANGTYGNITTSDGSAMVVVVGTPKLFSIRHRCQLTYTNGFGLACGFGNNEVYTRVAIRAA